MIKLGRHPTTIARELERGNETERTYGACSAQQAYHKRRVSSVPIWKYTTAIAEEINQKLQEIFIERKTRLYVALKMPDRTAHSMEVTFGVLASQDTKGTCQIATMDRGKEFACYTNLEAVYGVKVYFADAIRLINNCPCKCLGWRSAHEAFMDEMSHLA